MVSPLELFPDSGGGGGGGEGGMRSSFVVFTFETTLLSFETAAM